MQRLDVDTPDPTDATCKKATGKSLKEWFKSLDSTVADKGRREVVQHLYEALSKDEWWATTIAVEYEKARGQKEKDGKPKGYSICVTKTVAAPASNVFAAFGDAKKLDQWLGKGTKVAFSDGGSLQNADGDKLTWLRVRKDKDLRATWDSADPAPGSVVDVLFADKGGGKTGITLNHTRIQDRRSADQLRAGWGRCFDALKRLLESA
jgi:uncharacterized protein YndB with AHSA1/START domain